MGCGGGVNHQNRVRVKRGFYLVKPIKINFTRRSIRCTYISREIFCLLMTTEKQRNEKTSLPLSPPCIYSVCEARSCPHQLSTRFIHITSTSPYHIAPGSSHLPGIFLSSSLLWLTCVVSLYLPALQRKHRLAP